MKSYLIKTTFIDSALEFESWKEEENMYLFLDAIR